MDFINGEILYFDKPLNWTSFDVVNRVRRILCRTLGQKKLKVGHAGTLDPLATGIMVLCTGKATKRIEELQYGVKEYIATLQLGALSRQLLWIERYLLHTCGVCRNAREARHPRCTT